MSSSINPENSVGTRGVFTWHCTDAEGNLKWSETTYNIVTTEGKNWMLDVVLQNGVTSPVWYMTLVTTSTAVAAASTYAAPGNTEVGTGIFGTTRPTMTFGTASSAGTKSASSTTFSITGTATITGNLVVNGSSAVGNTTAAATSRLLSTSLFATAKSVSSGDTLNVTYSIQLT